MASEIQTVRYASTFDLTYYGVRKVGSSVLLGCEVSYSEFFETMQYSLELNDEKPWFTLFRENAEKVISGPQNAIYLSSHYPMHNFAAGELEIVEVRIIQVGA